jgi:hypothetical protein
MQAGAAAQPANACSWILRISHLRTKVTVSQDHHERVYSQKIAPQSDYNDGRGIRLLVKWTPLPPAHKPGAKRRWNAKPPSQNIVIYIHESKTLHTSLATIFEALTPIPELVYSWKGPINARHIKTEMFSVHATIPRSSFKDIRLETQVGYKDLLEQAMSKGSPEIKLVIVECKVCPAYSVYLGERAIASVACTSSY